MHYQHRFHAGNFADVFKHVLLTGLVQAIAAKGTPWAYLDTHAGLGRYRYDDEALRRTGEIEGGLRRVLGASDLRGWLEDYARAVKAEGPAHFPGSPALVAQLAGPSARLMFCELRPERAEALKAELAARAAEGRPTPRWAVHARDGFGAWALTPPPERRGLVLVDPPFEDPEELEHMLDFARETARRFGHGVQAHWYPLKARHAAERFARRLAQKTGREVLDARLTVAAAAEGRMVGCGLAVVNPPFAYRQGLSGALADLQRLLAQDEAAHSHIESHAP